MLLGLTAEEYLVLASAIVPFVLAVVVVTVFWRWAKRDEARHAAEARLAGDAEGRDAGGGPLEADEPS